MSQTLLIILLICGLLIWFLYRLLSPFIRIFRQVSDANRRTARSNPFFGEDPGEAQDRQRKQSSANNGEEQSTVDLIRETNMDLEGGEYVDYEEVK